MRMDDFWPVSASLQLSNNFFMGLRGFLLPFGVTSLIFYFWHRSMLCAINLICRLNESRANNRSSDGLAVLMPLDRHANTVQFWRGGYSPSPPPVSYSQRALPRDQDEELGVGFVVRAANEIAENIAQYLWDTLLPSQIPWSFYNLCPPNGYRSYTLVRFSLPQNRNPNHYALVNLARDR